MSHVLVYSQSSGIAYLEDEQFCRSMLTRGYSGHGTSINDPDHESYPGRGPIPRGLWKVGSPIHHERLGVLSFPLQPVGHDAHHRSEFFIHGDNSHGDRSASTGCIILGRPYREVIKSLRITTLEVII